MMIMRRKSRKGAEAAATASRSSRAEHDDDDGDDEPPATNKQMLSSSCELLGGHGDSAEHVDERQLARDASASTVREAMHATSTKRKNRDEHDPPTGGTTFGCRSPLTTDGAQARTEPD